MKKTSDLKIFITTRDSICNECGENLDAQAMKLAVIAHIRHTKTQYDTLLAKGYDRWDARKQVEASVDRVLDKWKNSM